MSDLSTQIDTVASGPKSTTVDGQTVNQHSIKDLIEADRHLGEENANNKSSLPIRLQKVRPGGPVL